MKICLLGDAKSIHTIRWCEYFREMGHDVSLISFRENYIKGIDVYFVGDSLNVDSSGGNAQYLKQLFKIKKILKEINPDIVNAHYLTSYGLIAALLKRGKLVISTWGSDILVTPNKNFLYKLITKYAIKRSDLLTSDSEFMSEAIYNLGASKEKVLTVPMGIEIKDFDISKRDDNNLDTFVSMRTICKNSNIDCIIKAFKIVLESKPESKLILTNSGEDEDYIKGLISELNLTDKVEYKGFVNTKQLIETLLKSHIYLSVPTSDSTSVTMLEAMASGSFPIVSDLPANREWIVDGENGYILKDITPKSLAELMIKASENKKIFNDAIEINRNIIRQRAIWSENMALINKKYLEII